MNRHRQSGFLALVALAAIATSAGGAEAQSKPAAGGGAGGLQAVLADDERLIGELSRLELSTLRDYMFEKNKVRPEDRAAYLAVSALKQLGDAKLSRKQQQELVNSVALGIDKVLPTINDPAKLMKLSNDLIIHGTTRPLNILEYFGESVKTQAQLRPIAEAIARVYDKAEAISKKQADEVANRMNAANQNVLGPQWEKLMTLQGLARFSAANNQHAVALSMDRADPKRAEAAQKGIEILSVYEDPQYEIVAVAKIGLGKLYTDVGTKEALENARKKFAEVLADPKATWSQKFESNYFAAVAEVVAKDFIAARKGLNDTILYVKNTPPENDAVLKGAEAAMKMLEFRIASGESEAGTGVVAQQANEQAIAVLQDLLQKRPDLAGTINEQLIARLPDQPDLSKLNVLLLKAMVGRGEDEIMKPADQSADKKAISQGEAAAREVIKRVGKDKNLSAEDAEKCTLLLAFFQARAGQDIEAVNTFLDFVEKYKRDANRLRLAYENAISGAAKLKKQQPNDRAANEAYNRLLLIAVGPPFYDMAFAEEAGKLLLARNIDAMKGDYTAAQAEQMLADAQRAADLFRKSPDEKRKIYVRYFELRTYDQMLDLAPKSPSTADWNAKVDQLADEVNALVNKVIDDPSSDNDAKRSARGLKVETSLLVANNAKDDNGPNKTKNIEHALALLANFEKDVEGMPNANALLGDALFIRVTCLMKLNQTQAALEQLGKFMEARPGDQGLGVLFQMIEALNKEFDQAEHDKDEARLQQLSGERAVVSGFLVQRVEQSKNPDLLKYLPKYKSFQAKALQRAALLEKDPEKRKQYLLGALKIFDEGVKADPTDRGYQLAAALVQFDLGNFAACQGVLNQLLSERLLGKPMIEQQATDGPRMVPNDAYWEAYYKLLRCNVELAKFKTGDEGKKLLEETTNRLKSIYIVYPEPGGPKWAPKFDTLRQEILPDWTPDAPVAPSQTQPVTAK